MAAYKESVYVVSAIIVKEARHQQGLILNIANNSGIRPLIKDRFREIKSCLKQYAQKNNITVISKM